MPVAEVNDTTLFYTEVGSGPLALVLHGGLGLDHTAYRSLDPLASRLRLVYYDHRGNGRSGRPGTDTLTMQQWADDAMALATLLVGDEEVVVIGHSYGGFIAQEVAIRHPGRLRGLVLIATTPGQLAPGEQPAPEGPPLPEEFGAMLAAMPGTDGEYAEAMVKLAPAYLHQTQPQTLLDLLAGTIFDVAAMRRGFEVLAGWSSVTRLPAVDVPTLIAVGRHDAITAAPQSDRIAALLADAEVAVFEHSGHFPWIEEPDAFFATVGGWLDRRLK